MTYFHIIIYKATQACTHFWPKTFLFQHEIKNSLLTLWHDVMTMT